MVDRYGFRDRDFRRPNKNRSSDDGRGRGVMRNRSKAVLILIAPIRKMFTDIHIRPMLYNFDDNDFEQRGMQLLESAGRGASSIDAMADRFTKGLQAGDHIIPSLQAGSKFKASSLSDRYRFILILTTDDRPRIMGNMRVSAREQQGRIRKIYTGLCLDEPYLPLSKKLDHDCRLEITKKVTTEVKTEETRMGTLYSLENHFSDDIVNPDLLQSLRQNPKDSHLLLPTRVARGVIKNGNSMSAAPGLATDIAGERDHMAYSENLLDPRKHLRTLSRAISLTSDDTEAEKRVSGYRKLTIDGSYREQDEQKTETLANYLGVPTSGVNDETDLDYHDEVNLGDIDDQFDPEVMDISVEDALYYDTSDQRENSMLNQFSYLISIITPAIMNSIGLNEVSFVYAAEKRRGEFDESFRIRSSEPIYDVNDRDLKSMHQAFKSEMRDGCLRQIYGAMGDFHLVCSCDATGITTVRLNPIALGIRNDVDFEMPTLLGGNISPMIGNLVDSATNTDSLVNLWNRMLGVEDQEQQLDDFELNPLGGEREPERRDVDAWDEENLGPSGFDDDVNGDFDEDGSSLSSIRSTSIRNIRD